MSREAKILIAILVVVVGGMITLFALTNKPKASTGPTADSSKLIAANSHTTGSGDVTIVEFGDFQCPACGAAFPNVQRIMQEYNGKVKLVFRNFPLQMHPNAIPAARAAEAAGLQGKFWPMYEKLYQTQADWENSTDPSNIFSGYAKELGLDVDKFNADMASDAVLKTIQADQSDGNALGITGTPTIYVNGQQSTSYSYDTLKSLVEEQLNKK